MTDLVIKTKHNIFLSLMTIYGLSSCGATSNDSSGGTPTTPPPSGSGPVAGQINGAPWTSKAGKASTNKDGKWSIMLFATEPEAPCYFQPNSKDASYVSFQTPPAPGDYPLAEVGTAKDPFLLNMVYDQGIDRPSMNYLTGQGRIVIDSLTVGGIIRGRLVAGDQDSHKISGEFAVPLCPDTQADRKSLSGAWTVDDLNGAASVYKSQEGAYVLLAPYLWGEQLNAKKYRVEGEAFTSSVPGGSFSYLKSSRQLLQEPFKGNAKIWARVDGCPADLPALMRSGCSLMAQATAFNLNVNANTGLVTTISLESPFGLRQSNEKLADILAMSQIIEDHQTEFQAFAATHKLKFLVLANSSPLHTGFYKEDETFDLYPLPSQTSGTLKNLLGVAAPL